MVNRREWLQVALGGGAGLAFLPQLLEAAQQGRLIHRGIPSTGEMLPIVGLGSANTFQAAARGTEVEALKQVIKALVDQGGKVLDTAPSYGTSELVAGDLANELGVASKIFWATKVNVAGRGGAATPVAARAQIEESFRKFKRQTIDLIQVHNLSDVPTHLAVLKDLKREGRVRYIGVTTTSDNQYGELEQVMRNEPLDFIGLDYAIDNRNVETTILPLAQQRKIGVIAYLPFGRNRLMPRVAGKELPSWASELDAKTWAQFFIKYIAAHPAITVVTPGTSKPEHMIDNMGGAAGRLPDDALRKRMAAYIDALPPG